jgi:hypothetical protein
MGGRNGVPGGPLWDRGRPQNNGIAGTSPSAYNTIRGGSLGRVDNPVGVAARHRLGRQEPCRGPQDASYGGSVSMGWNPAQRCRLPVLGQAPAAVERRCGSDAVLRRLNDRRRQCHPQFALGVEKAGRSPGQPGAVPSWAALGDGTIDAGSSAPRRMGARRRGTAGSPWSSVAVRAVFLS